MIVYVFFIKILSEYFVPYTRLSNYRYNRRNFAETETGVHPDNDHSYVHTVPDYPEGNFFFYIFHFSLFSNI